MSPLKQRSVEFLLQLQDQITQALERLEPSARFQEHPWQRPGGGGGRSRILSEGEVFEKAGVNFSQVEGELPESLQKKLPGNSKDFFATGVSLVIHPRSPQVPIVHMNYRLIYQGDTFWFGGGQDLTPIYFQQEDAVHFHRTIKESLDQFDPKFYPNFKKQCDDYFTIPHRKETRGIGGIFFDYIKDPDFESCWRKLAKSFLPSYLPIVEKRKDHPTSDQERHFQLLRRGRYVEFNLVYDRGTKFGLETAGNIESILMSLPPLVRWEFNYQPEPNSPEEETMANLRPQDWI